MIESLKLRHTDSNEVTIVRPMQRVLVNVSCDPDHTRELKLELIKGLNDLETQHVDEVNGFNEFLNNMVSKDRNEGAFVSSVSEAALVSSVYRIVLEFRNPVRVSISTTGYDDLTSLLDRLALVMSNEPLVLNPAKFTKLLKQVRLLRHPLKGTGRIAFGPLEAVRSVFSWVRESALLGGGGSVRRSEESASAALGSGHQAAMMRMREWGEEWAEEEELPRESVEETQSPVGQNNDSTLASMYRKDVSISSQRITKLKVAKRKSKFN